MVVPRIRHVDRTLAAWIYEGSARDLVLALKLRSLAYAARPLADALWQRVAASGSRAAIITWVPARRSDIRRRGFDHARVIAESLAMRTGLPHRELLVRVGSQQDQAGLSRSERVTNLAGAFEAEGTDVPVMVVDDLLTTGATIEACARALRAAGAPRVEAGVACLVE
ncbi:MAG: hypothetical protein QOC87_322 [Actinomycetota bacterium]|jgi:predicted amidophosphoribosyltransferase|nr:hypothetical protein [Actinomycetota bacterium]